MYREPTHLYLIQMVEDVRRPPNIISCTRRPRRNTQVQKRQMHVPNSHILGYACAMCMGGNVVADNTARCEGPLSGE